MGADDTTDKLFPPPEGEGTGVRPIPLSPSIRQEFLLHRLKIEEGLAEFRLELNQALERLAPYPTPAGAVRRGVVVAGKAAPVVVAALALVEVVLPLVRPEWVGPLKAIREALGAPQ